MSEEAKLRGLANRLVVGILIALVFALAVASCKAKEADVTGNIGEAPKPLTLEVQGKNAKALTFGNWTFERMNGNNPVFAGKITYNGGTLTQVNAFCLQDGMKSIAYLIFNTNLKPGESAKGELHCAQITTPPEKIIVELN